jgi:hypothetical protein
VQLKDALNVVWDVQESEESGLWHFARNYMLSLAAVFGARLSSAGEVRQERIPTDQVACGATKK